jgi:hypothetical protein
MSYPQNAFRNIYNPGWTWKILALFLDAGPICYDMPVVGTFGDVYMSLGAVSSRTLYVSAHRGRRPCGVKIMSRTVSKGNQLRVTVHTMNSCRLTPHLANKIKPVQPTHR